MKQARKYFLLALAVIIVDQVVKLIVKFNMVKGPGGEIPILGDLFKLHFIENRGAAFGLTISNLVQGIGLDMSESTGKLILSLFSIAAVIAIGFVLYSLRTHKSPLPTFVALIFGGAMGNIIDRTFYGTFFPYYQNAESIASFPEGWPTNDYDGGLFFGRVVDMFYFDIYHGPLPDWLPIWGGDQVSLWPIFNIADSAISIGIVVILLFQGRFFKQDEAAKEEITPVTGDTADQAVASATGEKPEVPTEQEVIDKAEEAQSVVAEEVEADSPEDDPKG